MTFGDIWLLTDQISTSRTKTQDHRGGKNEAGSKAYSKRHISRLACAIMLSKVTFGEHSLQYAVFKNTN